MTNRRNSSQDNPRRPDRSDRPKRGDKPERPDRSKRGGKPNRSGKFQDRNESQGSDRYQRSGNFRGKNDSKGSDKPRRSGKFQDRDESQGSDRYQRSGKPDRKGQSARGGKPQRKESRRPTRGGTRKGSGKSSSGLPDRVAQKEYLRDEIRLNKFIAHAGFCSRRDADEYISSGKVTVNGKIVTEMGIKIKPTAKVIVDGQLVSLEPFIYILLNKDKNTISTTDDERDRRTVLDAVENATGHRVYPVGRLDRNTLGLLLLTNDGDLAHRLMHPSYKVKKTYEVGTDRVLTDEEIQELKEGITLEDGPVKPSSVKPDPGNPFFITITIHEGRNHLVRRMIAYTGAEVTRLKRVRYAGLTDKDLRVSRWRYLKNKEVNQLRQLVKLEPLDFNQDDD